MGWWIACAVLAPFIAFALREDPFAIPVCFASFLLFAAAISRVLGFAPLGWLWRVPTLFWLVATLGVFAIGLGWLLVFQPSAGVALRVSEGWFIVASLVGWVGLATSGLTRTTLQTMGDQMHWRVNLLIVVGTLLLLLFGLELVLRYAVVMSDNFAFSKMHQNWVRLYWNPINELGYRDDPLDPSEERTHILVMGDSLASGYGINSIRDTFPHVMGDALGAPYAVNIAAEPGWGTGTARAAVQQFPLIPDILVLSFYLNDIVEGDAARVYSAPFPAIRVSPSTEAAWWIENLYIANFYYYRLYHYSTVQSGQQYLDWVLNAFTDPTVWAAYQGELDQVRQWASDNGVMLVAVVWGNMPDLERSRDATNAVVDYFKSHDVPVVDMPALLQGQSASQLVVNAFDAHPSVYAHKIAGEALLTLIQAVSPTTP
jgi:hypothetical protein